MSEWTTKEELAKNLNINPVDIDLHLAKVIDNGFAEEKDGKYKINNQDGKAKNRVSNYLNNLDTKYYPKIRHGYLHLKHKFKSKVDYPEEVKKQSKELGYDLDTIPKESMLDGAELFEIDDKTKWILKLTNNSIFKRNQPYKSIVLDCDLELDGIWFKGILITKEWVFSYWGNNDGYCDNPLFFNLYDETDKLSSYFLENLKKSTINKLKVFICNFFDFINNPEIRIIRVERSKKNRDRRRREGKEVLPSANKIRITGQLKTYYDKLEISGRSLDYKFWVRGHFMRLWDKKKFHNLYKKLEYGNLPQGYYVDDKIRHKDKIIMIWKKPFIKGSGVLISKRYEVKK